MVTTEKMVDLLNKHFASVSRSEKKTLSSKALSRHCKAQKKVPDEPGDLATFNSLFGPLELAQAIARTKNKKPAGPD